ncbi:DUF4270 domain-containing protein [Aureivirga sp. CE67]|uniref:DUF4270 domain-containing protein n=1 Tax=Aureivirga sp. CE67 TaxID=1788983 RepID=UPI0018CB9FCB|nr:DUF4270 domain-containing protein [Aureivirga sp. CE67]
MTIKVAKYISLLLLSSFVISCDKELENSGVDLIDNDKFSTRTYTSQVKTTTENVESVRTDNAPNYLLGIYDDPDFGVTTGSIVSQLRVPFAGLSFDETARIDAVILEIPYYYTNDGVYDDNKPKFKLDSVYGNAQTPYRLKVNRVATYLNNLDPEDPSKQLKYYSDKDYELSDLLAEQVFVPNPNDTMIVISRRAEDGTIYEEDERKSSPVRPSIKISLDPDFFTNNFLGDENKSKFTTNDDFIDFFRGIYIQAEPIDGFTDASLIQTNLDNAKLTVYFSETIDGENTPSLFNFGFNNVTANNFENSTITYNPQNNYVQGAGGSITTISLFGQDSEDEIPAELEELRTKNWIINEARLVFNVNDDLSSDFTPDRLLIYNYDKNRQLPDVFGIDGFSGIGGSVEKDDDGKAIKYTFRITDYITNLLDESNDEELNKLAIKVYNTSDAPQSNQDFLIKDYGWNPKRVVLYGSESPIEDKKVKLEIIYSEIN